MLLMATRFVPLSSCFCNKVVVDSALWPFSDCGPVSVNCLGAVLFRVILQRTNSSITTLSIAWNKFRREGSKAIATGLAGNRGVKVGRASPGNDLPHPVAP